jgi:anti-sigma factor RsiW
VSCREFVDFLIDYQSGALSAAERACFEDHLAECPNCVTYMQTYRSTIELSKLACRSSGHVPEDVPEELVQAILAARRAR